MVVGAMLAGDGRPLSYELWSGNQAYARTLLLIVDRLQQRFRLTRICWVADRGMVSQDAIDGIEARQLIGNRGYRRFLRVVKGAVSIDTKKIAAEARYDGKFMIRINISLPSDEVAMQYKRLLLVEQFFRATKSLLETRPTFHQWNATIRGHVFCSFLALVLVDNLKRRLGSQGLKPEWDIIRQDLEAPDQARVSEGDQWYPMCGPLQCVVGKMLQAVDVASPPPVRPS